MEIKRNIMQNKVLSFLFMFMLLISNTGLYAQIQQMAKYQVIFKNKAGTPYSLTNPSEYLSQRAIQRRIHHGIAIDSTDLPINPQYIQGVLAIDGILLHKSKWFNFITIALADTTNLAAIRALPYVQSVNLVYPAGGQKSKENRRRLRGQQNEEFCLHMQQVLPAAKMVQNGFSVKNLNYGMGYNQATMIGVEYLHALGFTGQGIIIGVFDAGFYQVNNLSVFDSLWAQGRILGYKDFVEPGGDVFMKSTHGMAVLSIMGGNLPGHLVGTAPHASYWLFRTEDEVTEFRIEELNWIAAAEFADSAGVDVFNTSLGYTQFDDPSMDYTYADMNGQTAWITRGADMAFSKGIFVVNSAGNSGNSPWKYIGAAADGFNVLAIGAVDENGSIAPFSSHGPTSDGRVKPNVVAQGQNTAVVSAGGNIVTGNGTSFSSPVVAGAVACLWQANPLLTNVQLKKAIEQSASLYPVGDTLYGYGIPNFAAAHLIANNQTNTEDPFLLVYPVPFENELYVIFQAKEEQIVKVEIIDIRGRRIYLRENIRLQTGYNNILLDNLKGKSGGVYYLRVIHANGVHSKQIIKL